MEEKKEVKQVLNPKKRRREEDEEVGEEDLTKVAQPTKKKRKIGVTEKTQEGDEENIEKNEGKENEMEKEDEGDGETFRKPKKMDPVWDLKKTNPHSHRIQIQVRKQLLSVVKANNHQGDPSPSTPRDNIIQFDFSRESTPAAPRKSNPQSVKKSNTGKFVWQ